MSYPYEVDTRLASIGDASTRHAALPSSWDDATLALVAKEFALVQDLFMGDRDTLLLPASNLVFISALLILECDAREIAPAGTSNLFKILAELQRLVEREILRRAGGETTAPCNLQLLLKACT